MMRRLLRHALAVLILAALPLDASAQLPPATAEQRAAGGRVASVEFSLDELVIERGATVSLEARLLDADGNAVEGAVAVFFAQAGVSPTFVPLTDGSVAEFTGQQPGQGQLALIIMVSEDRQGVFGTAGAVRLADLPVRVTDWPAASIEIDDPTHAAYVGTSLRMAGHVVTDRGTEHSTADITWRSSNSSIATVTSGGVVSGLTPGSVSVTASTENNVVARLDIEVVANPVTALSITPRTAQARTGDVVEFDIVPSDASGRSVTDAFVDLSVSGLDGTGGFVFEDGSFVAEQPGAYRVIASVGGVSSAALVEVVAREAAPPVEFVAHGARSEVSTSDLWVFEGVDGRDYAYTGTHARGGGERMFVWDVTDPANVALLDSVVVNARVVNDVKVSDDATWAIITREGASTRRNGIVVLDLQDPAHPTIMAELTDELTAGIHNVWIMGDVVYAVNDGTSAMNIIDMSDPAGPRNAGRWELRPGDTDKSLHDVWGRRRVRLPLLLGRRSSHPGRRGGEPRRHAVRAGLRVEHLVPGGQHPRRVAREGLCLPRRRDRDV